MRYKEEFEDTKVQFFVSTHFFVCSWKKSLRCEGS